MNAVEGEPTTRPVVPATRPVRWGGEPRTGVLYGRESELSVLTGLLEHARERLITLTGPAGVGKSRLAEAAVTALAGIPGAPPHLWVDLAEAGTGADAGRAAWAPLGAGTAREAAARLGDAGLLLVLDDCDPVAGAIALDLAALLRACPRLKVLVTSRVSLDIQAERILPVDPLPTGAGSPAEAVFTDRLQAADRVGLRGPQIRSTVTDICRQLDGIPLAIEMAAEAVGTQGPYAVLEQLARGEFTGRRRVRDAPDRHRSIEGTLAWASHAIGSEDRELLRALTVFHGPVPVSAVRQVAGTGRAAALAGIESLLHKSLLLSRAERGGEPEYRLTHMARYHYRKELAADPAALHLALDRHAGYCASYALSVAAGLRSGDQGDQLLAEVRDRLPDLIAATRRLRDRGDHARLVRLLIALEGPLLGHGLAPEAADQIEQSIAATAVVPLDGRLTAEALMTVARTALARGEHQRARRALDRAAGAARELPAVRARVASLTGELLRHLGEMTEASALLDRAAGELDAAGDTRAAALARRSLSLVRAELGAPDSEEPLLRALDELPSVLPADPEAPWLDPEPPAVLRARLLTALARVRRALGRAPQAYEDVRAATRILMDTGGPGPVADALEAMALISSDTGQAGRPHAVARVLSHAEALRRRHGLVSEEGPALSVLNTRLRETVDASLLRRLRLASQDVSLRDALVAGLFVPPQPRTEPPAAGLRSGPAGLTPRQHQIALLVAEGLTNRQAAGKLGISEWTVANHLRVVMQKLQCTSRVHVVRAVQQADR
ncbi:helix-turn-helix transcriptional regulator [Streptomyces goshikiensis]